MFARLMHEDFNWHPLISFCERPELLGIASMNTFEDEIISGRYHGSIQANVHSIGEVWNKHRQYKNTNKIYKHHWRKPLRIFNCIACGDQVETFSNRQKWCARCRRAQYNRASYEYRIKHRNA